MSCRRVAGSHDAGPIVATIFVRRMTVETNWPNGDQTHEGSQAVWGPTDTSDFGPLGWLKIAAMVSECESYE